MLHDLNTVRTVVNEEILDVYRSAGPRDEGNYRRQFQREGCSIVTVLQRIVGLDFESHVHLSSFTLKLTINKLIMK